MVSGVGTGRSKLKNHGDASDGVVIGRLGCCCNATLDGEGV